MSLDPLFYSNPLPMWIYNTETLVFLEVNAAAIANYGYSRAEFLQMTITDIRPEADVSRLSRLIRTPRPDWLDAGIWQHKLKNGTLIYVRVISHNYRFRGQPARFVMALNVTEQKRAERETIHALERTKRQTIKLQRVNRLAQRMTPETPLDQLLQEITDEARQIIGTHQAATRLTDWVDEQKSIRAISFSRNHAENLTLVHVPHSPGLDELVCKTNRSLRLTRSQLEAHPAWRELDSSSEQTPLLNGWLAAPLINRAGRNMGLIQLCNKTDGEFDGDDEVILEHFANMVAGLVENVQLYTALQATEERTTTLYQLTSRLAVINDRATAIQEVVDQTCTLLGAKWGVFLLMPGSPNQAETFEIATRGFDGAADRLIPGITEIGAIGEKVLVQQQSFVVPDVTAEPIFHRSSLKDIVQEMQLDLCGFLGVPVVSDAGKSLGGMFFGSPTAGHFDSRAQHLAEAIGANAGVVLEKLLLQQEIQSYASTLSRPQSCG